MCDPPRFATYCGRLRRGRQCARWSQRRHRRRAA
jgi:hypothetical protein